MLNNVYVELKNNNKKRPVIMLDAHTDEIGFMVQAINENGLLEYSTIRWMAYIWLFLHILYKK